MPQPGKGAGAAGAAFSSGLWQDVTEVPGALAATLEERGGFVEAATLVSRSGARRLVVSGNGAAYYVAMALWLASLAGQRPGPEVCAVPSGLLARGRFAWRPGDMFVAVSSSGEFRDLVEAIDAGVPRPYLALTSSPTSTVGRDAAVRATFRVFNQRALTHSQVFCGAVAAALSVWAAVTEDTGLLRHLSELPDRLGPAIDRAPPWGEEVVDALEAWPRAALTCGTRAGWAAALEAALLLKEVARVPAEGAETREAATSGMYALGPADLALSLPSGDDDPLLDEAERVFKRTGAAVLRAPGPTGPVDHRITAITSFPASAALAVALARRGGFDPDKPAWASTYYETARSA